ncbi:MAG: Rieske 2Fe-2S domain-containing protein [Anaerolineales bacterium]|nr:Rieske 2Fe-2S domain-containing protein [Anaerolineales bacterium]
MAAAAREAPTAKTPPSVAPMSRREFLYYIWAASMALFLAETGGAILWFAVPRFKAGEFGGVFELDVTAVPAPDSDPVSYDAGRFWLVNIGQGDIDRQYSEHPQTQTDYPQTQGVKALYKICVHLGCLYKWVPTNHRFECPCHGSKYLPTGIRVDGPARRNLDVFIVQAVDANGSVLAQTEALAGNLEGSAVTLPSGTAKLRIDTGKRIVGEVNSKPGGGK